VADRYWVGGSGSWNSTTKWSTTSGGASGASVPTASDNAIFDANSGTAHFTVTVTANSTCANLTITPEPADGVTQFVVDNDFVIAGTFSTSGTQGNRRIWFRSSTYGLMRDMQIATIGTVTDVDFRDIRITGTGGTLTGTRIGDLRGNKNITFSTPKTVYWVTAGGGNWSGNNWAASSGAGASTDNFPLAQDTAVIENTGLNTSATVTMDSAVAYTGTVDISTRTNAMTLGGSASYSIYGNWKFSSSVTRTYTGTLSFEGRTTQVITSAGIAFGGSVEINTYGGVVELADAISSGTQNISVLIGTFDTKNYSVTAASLSSSNSNVRTITLGSSTVTTSGTTAINFATSTNLTFNAGTSTISAGGNTVTISGGDQTFYNATFTATTAATKTISGNNTFNNITVTAPAAAGLMQLVLSGSQTITGTLTVAGASPVRRIFVRSDTLGTTRTLTVGTLSATDCDFRDITIAGAAAGSSPTRAGDCGGNSGITFPAPKTVYWDLAGAQNWSATAWCTASGGTPDINQFPLAQDTAVFDEAAGSVTGTITIDQAWNIGTFDASLRTSAMTLTTSTNAPVVYGDWKFGTGVTSSSTAGTITFAKRGTQTITSNGRTFGCPVAVDNITGMVQLADAFSMSAARVFTLTTGTFDAISYNVSVAEVSSSGSSTRTLKMGSGTWTLTGASSGLWDLSNITGLTFYKGTANITLSDTSTTARTFAGGGLSYNKLTIGGTTGTSTTTISGNNQFTELASTKTVAHTIALGSTTQTFGKWTVTGTAGNVVTLTGTGTGHLLAGAATSGIDYLAMGSIGFSSVSPGEFYAGANSTGTAAAPVYRTAPPTPRTVYWVGGTGNWNDTARWSTTSGSGSGAALPTSLDDVVFDAGSNATAYTSTVNATSRCNKLTIAGPASGNVTLAGSSAIIIHDDVTLPATGLTRTFTGFILLSGSTSGKVLTTNGVTLNSSIVINGVNCEWSLGSALNNSATAVTVTNGLFALSTYNLTASNIISNNGNTRTLDFGSGTVDLSGSTPIDLGTTETNAANLTVTAGTSQINCSPASPTFSGNGKTFYNVAFTSTSAGTVTINGANSFNNLSFTGIAAAGLKSISLTANQTVTGTLTCSAGTNATMRHFVRSDTLGTTRTLTCAAVSLTDVDFRDITIAGAAAPATGTRIGDCKGNSGITFTAAANKYWNLAAGGNWGGAIGWATSSGDTPAINNFPLAQDTCFFEATGLNSGATITVNAAYNIGTIDMSARTTNTMTLACSQAPTIYGNWINGTGTTLSGAGTLTFSGRGSQTITSAGNTFTQGIIINSPNGSVNLQDSLITSKDSVGISVVQGTFDANSYNVTLSNATGNVTLGGSLSRILNIGSGAWTIASSGTAWSTSSTASLTVTGTGTISLTSASAKTFAGGGIDYSGITLNQGGAGTLTVSGNNTFKTITNTYSATGATAFNFGTTTTRITNPWTASGEATRILTIQGTSATSPCTLIYTGAGQAANVDYLTITGVRAYPL